MEITRFGGRIVREVEVSCLGGQRSKFKVYLGQRVLPDSTGLVAEGSGRSCSIRTRFMIPTRNPAIQTRDRYF